MEIFYLLTHDRLELKMTAKPDGCLLARETRHKEKKGKLPVEGALVHEAAHAPASELALAGWLAGEGHAGAIAELNWGCWVGLGLGGGAVQTPARARAPRR